MNSTVDKYVIMITKELEGFETESDFPWIGRGVKTNTGVPRTAAEKIDSTIRLKIGLLELNA